MDMRERLCGAEVTRGANEAYLYILYSIYIMCKSLPCTGRQINKSTNLAYIIY